jgi:hypothetical protein
MAQAVSRRPLTAEGRVLTLVRPCGICGGQSGTGILFPRVFQFLPANIIPPWLSMLLYHLGDEQEACRWPQFRDILSPIDMNNNNLHSSLTDVFCEF